MMAGRRKGDRSLSEQIVAQSTDAFMRYSASIISDA